MEVVDANSKKGESLADIIKRISGKVCWKQLEIDCVNIVPFSPFVALRSKLKHPIVFSTKCIMREISRFAILIKLVHNNIILLLYWVQGRTCVTKVA